MVPAVVLLAGCGSGGSGSDSEAAAQSQANGNTGEPVVKVAGAAVKGIIQQGMVTANRLIADKDGTYSLDRLAAKTVRTAEDGSYELQLRGKADGWALVELRTDQQTRMVCDVLPGCDQAGGGTIVFGQTLSLDSEFSLRGAGDLISETVYLTPLTHLAVAVAERNLQGLSPDALAGAYTTVENWFGLSAGALHLSPPDLTQLDQLNDVSADALQVAIANAAFLALVNDNPQWSTISHVLSDMTTQIADTGQIQITGDGESLALSDLVAASALQASELQLVVDSSIISQKLAVVENRNVQRFKTIAGVYDESDTSLADSGETTSGSDGAIDGGDGSGTDTSGDTTDSGSTGTAIPADAALLSWTAPLTRENGDSLSMGEIAGYEVVYGTSADAMDQSLAIGDASVDELLVDQLSEGTWYFAMRTLDTDGNRSQLSEVVYKQI
ncbi:hypothetical protein MARLIPOL_12689 [Marinobacter lipolyticus SM19]|uniref:Fibronectin type-III domain-containing protein n=1 Tax=Marinobacter lipolyticus SM19 TaxID=1318628 RepID=R8AYZ0_9GAMM|nr:hypothetical protein MARLIPOL_12689 [Marinobacter lipolyticus SM19]